MIKIRSNYTFELDLLLLICVRFHLKNMSSNPIKNVSVPKFMKISDQNILEDQVRNPGRKTPIFRRQVSIRTDQYLIHKSKQTPL